MMTSSNLKINTRLTYTSNQNYLRYITNNFKKLSHSLLFLTHGASKLKYSYLDTEITRNILKKDKKRLTNIKIDSLIKQKNNHLVKIKTFKDIMSIQAEFKKFLVKSYDMSYPLHPWNIVDKSPWPFTTGMSVLFFILGALSFMHGYGAIQMVLGFILVIISFISWNKDIVREGSYHGKHTSFVTRCLKTGFKFFVVSEFMLFVSFFWTFYNFYFNGSVETSYVYPPVGIGMDDKLPGIMNLILILSGCIITFGHVHYKLRINRMHILSLQRYLALTILFGMIFISFQVYEYCHNSFTFSDSTFGSVFYILTGCHSLHVIIGVTFLLVSFIRNYKYHTTYDHNLNYLLAVWYWHFVDVIWVFLYIKIYYLFHYIRGKTGLDFHYAMYDLGSGSMYFNYYELLLEQSLKELNIS